MLDHVREAFARAVFLIVGVVLALIILLWALPEYLHFLFWKIITP